MYFSLMSMFGLLSLISLGSFFHILLPSQVLSLCKWTKSVGHHFCFLVMGRRGDEGKHLPFKNITLRLHISALFTAHWPESGHMITLSLTSKAKKYSLVPFWNSMTMEKWGNRSWGKLSGPCYSGKRAFQNLSVDPSTCKAHHLILNHIKNG